MSATRAIVAKQMVESRWLLGLSALALFGISWLTVYIESRFEANQRALQDSPEAAMRGNGFRMFARAVGGDSVDNSSGAMEVALWCHPLFVYPLVMAWALARGSSPVAGELDRGRLDLVLSRPISRSGYLGAHVTVAILGLVILGGALVAGNLAATRAYPIEAPPGLVALSKAAGIVCLLGFAIYGYTLAFSAADRTWWRPVLFGLLVTIGGGIASGVGQLLAQIQKVDRYRNLRYVSIFHYFDPVAALVGAKEAVTDTWVFLGVAMTGLVVAFLIFVRRDLPTSG